MKKIIYFLLGISLSFIGSIWSMQLDTSNKFISISQPVSLCEMQCNYCDSNQIYSANQTDKIDAFTKEHSISHPIQYKNITCFRHSYYDAVILQCKRCNGTQTLKNYSFRPFRQEDINYAYTNFAMIHHDCENAFIEQIFSDNIIDHKDYYSCHYGNCNGCIIFKNKEIIARHLRCSHNIEVNPTLIGNIMNKYKGIDGLLS